MMQIPVRLGISPTLNIRGLLAERDLDEDDLVEEAPVVLIPITQEAALEQTALKVYYFLWDDTYYCLALGYGSLFNHSYDANVYFTRDYEQKRIVFRTVRRIRQGEELFINYNGVSDDDTPLDPDFLR